MVEHKALLAYRLQFFAKDGPGGEKTEEPTQKKIDDSRKEGQVAKSKEVASTLTLIALFLMLKFWISMLGNQLLELFPGYYDRMAEYVTLAGGQISTGTFSSLISYALQRIAVIILPFLLVGFVVCFVADLVQVKWKPTTKPLQPKFSKINPASGVKKLFSLQSLVELLKSILKIGIIVIVIYNEFKEKWQTVLLVYHMPLMQAVVMAGDMLINIGLKIALIFIVVAAADYIFQRWKHHEDLKMTKQEVKDEFKNTEGDPQIKGKIRQRMMEASRRRMMQDLPKADVVITNPTHYAVAIRYDTDIADAPFVVAKGVDYLAQKIKEIARENHIEIMENKPLARSLYANVEIGEQIPQELYVAVAEVLAAVSRAQGKI
ncbi:MAG: flagellar biosynthesis protein FlhB [Lachnospiraceae bacterium]|nr:flagellar biosynthesis protein FlhB [Lachnospiraceae bacterium]